MFWLSFPRKNWVLDHFLLWYTVKNFPKQINGLKEIVYSKEKNINSNIAVINEFNDDDLKVLDIFNSDFKIS